MHNCGRCKKCWPCNDMMVIIWSLLIVAPEQFLYIFKLLFWIISCKICIFLIQTVVSAKFVNFGYNIIFMHGIISNNLLANCHSTPFQEFFVLYHSFAKFVNCRTVTLLKVVLRSVSFFKDQLLNCQMLLCIFIPDQLFANHRPRSFSMVLAKFTIPLGII